MKPMGLNSTPFITYQDIIVDGIDLYEDAFGICPEFSNLFDMLRQVNIVPDKRLTCQLIEKIRKQG